MRILIAEDERLTRLKLHRTLEKMGHDVADAADGRQAWEMFQAEPFSIVIADWEMPEINGLELVQLIRAADCPGYVYIVMLTGRSDKKDVVEGIEAGADDFVSKPFDRDELRARLSAGQRIVDLEHDLASANDRLHLELAVAKELADTEHRKHEESLLGNSIPVRALREGIKLHAEHHGPLLLSGQTGAGQEAVARAIHRSSNRRRRAFIYVACAHIADANESIYGFQSKVEENDRFGKAKLADGGTLFLENVETLSEHSQAQLVDFLKDSASQRSQGAKLEPDVRVIAYLSESRDGDSTGIGLCDELSRTLGQHRLAVPSLAERRDDISIIAESIISRRAVSAGKIIEGLTDEAVERLLQYSWPGNIRELQSVVERAVLLNNGTNLEIPEELLREGRRVGGYILQRRLGVGGMGEVWLAQHSLLARPSAVKLIRQSALRGDVNARAILKERFQREANATSQLRSPNTVELYDFGVTDDGDFYYVMEYLNGVDLYSLVNDFGPVDPARAVFLMTQACMSLGEAHLAGLVHRDIKPENLFACQLGTQFDFLKLLDFGIVRDTVGIDKTETSTGQIKGTPSSISPEAAQGEQVSFASDIYGLGCVTFWLLTGRHVFEAPSIMALLLQHVSKQPQPPSDFSPNIPIELDELVLRCLAKNPADRPRDGLELAELLATIRFEQPWDNRRAQTWWDVNLPFGDQAASRDETAFVSSSETNAESESEHPPEHVLLKFCLEELSNEKTARILRHLETCTDCALDVDQLRELAKQESELIGPDPDFGKTMAHVPSSAVNQLVSGETHDEFSLNPQPAKPVSKGTPVNRVLHSAPDDWMGRRLGKYKITGLLGVGETGMVFKAHDTSIERDVAIKILTKAFYNNEVVLKRFLAEAKTAGKFEHVNTVTIHEVVRDGATCYLVMEIVSGGNANDHLEQSGGYSAVAATQIVIEACRGLSAAHKSGLVHRDIKPANLLLTDEGVVKVSDFGLAKKTNSQTIQLTMVGQVIGTPHYMSPEQCESKEVDARSDIYSLGATYYSLLTGARPYEESDAMQLMLDQCNAEPPDPRKLLPEVPAACAQIIEFAMAKRPDQRYQSMDEMQSDLEAVLAAISEIRSQ
jgi:serine/threonine protein kinase/CheY-like chemotaxis protein